MTFCPRSLRTTKVLHPDGGGSICAAKYNRFCLVAAPDDSVPILLQALEKDTVYGGVIFACLERCGAQPDVVPLLVKAATGPRRDPSDKWDSRDDALFALGNLRPVDRRAVAALIEVAKGPDPQLRWWAIEPLEKIGVADERVLPALTELVLLPARDGQHREEAADAIPGEDCPFEGLHRDDEKYRESAADNAAKAISRLGVDDATMEALITASSHPEPTVRRLAVRVLVEAGPKAKRAVTALIARMRDDEALVRDSARVALARLGPLASDAVPALIADIDKYEGYWQQSPAWVLSEIGPSAVPALIKRLKETKADELKEWDAHESLFRFREKARSAVPDLVEMLDRNDFRTRINVLRILEGIGPAAAPAVPKLAAMLNPPADPDEFGGNVAFFAQRALIAIGEDAVPVFVSRLELDDKQQRQQALDALRSMGRTAESAVMDVVSALTDNERDVRFAAAETLCAISEMRKAAVPVIHEMFEQKDAELRLREIRLIPAIAKADSTGHAKRKLLDGLRDENENVRFGAARAVIEIGGTDAKQTIPILIQMLGHSNWQINLEGSKFALNLLAPMDNESN